MSSKIKLAYILIGLLLLLVSIKAAMALQEDFNAYATEKVIYACSCASSQDKIIVENTGDITSTYSVEQTGKGVDFSSITENAFNLDPGESKEITNFIRAPCGITGEFELKTEFETVFGLKKEFMQTVVVKDCVNVNLMMLEVPLPVCPCSPAKYTFIVENTGTFLETYKVGIDSEYAEISEDILILEPQKRENVTIFITTPCGSYGDIEFVLTVSAERSEMIAELPFILRVAPCYNYTLNALSQYSVCRDINNLIPITIKNTADVKNTYFLDVGADWAIFENSSISLWGGEEKNVNLNVYPAEVEPANYNLTIDAVTVRGEIRKSLNLAANVENCYSLNLSVESDYAQVVNGEKSSVKIKLENDGTRTNEYSLNLTSPGWVSLELGRLSLDPGTGKEINLNYDVPVNATGRHDILVSANMVDFPEKVRFVGMTLDIVSVEDAYRVEIDTPVKKLETNYDGKTIPITISNLGIRKGEYQLSLYGNNWTSLNKTTVEIEPQQTAGVGLILNPVVNVTPEGKYPATIDSLLNDTNIAYSRTFDIKLRQETLWEKISGFFGDYWIYIAASLLALLILLVAIIGIVRYRKKHPPEEKKVKEEKFIEEEKPSWLKRILLLLLILLILAGIGFAAYYFAFLPLFEGNFTNVTNITEPEPLPPAPEPEPVTNATIFVNRTGLSGYGNVIEVVGMENITIPLIIQNSDEPNTYIISVSENISWIKTDKSIVNIPPNERETVNIFVMPTPEVEEGNYNLSININIAGREKPISEEIVLSVKEKEPFYEKYMWYLIGGILALIIVFALIKWKERKEEFEELETIEKVKKEKEPRDYSKIKNFFVILILALIALALIGGMVYFGVKFVPTMMKAENVTTDITEEQQEAVPDEVEEVALEEPEEVEEEEEEQIPDEAYERVFVKKESKTLIPIKITNVNKTTTFRISIKENVTWLYAENKSVEIGPDENKTVNLVASPNATVEDGNYKVSVDIDIAEGEKMFSRYFILKVRKSRFSDLWSYLYYILAGLAVLFVLIKILGRKEDVSEEKPEKKEKKPKKKKTKIKLK